LKFDAAIRRAAAATAAARAKAAEAAADRCRLAKTARSNISYGRSEVHRIEQVIKIDTQVKVIGLAYLGATEKAATATTAAWAATCTATAAAITAAAATSTTPAAASQTSSTCLPTLAALATTRHGRLCRLAETEVFAETEIHRKVTGSFTEISGYDSIRILAGDIAIR
jgi:hypothetical protein